MAKQGGAFLPLRGGVTTAKAFRGKEGFKESQALQKKLTKVPLKKLYKISKPYIKKNMPKFVEGRLNKTVTNKVKKRFLEKLYKSNVMKDVAKSVKSDIPKLKPLMDKQIQHLNKYQTKLTSGWHGLREKSSLIKKYGKRVENYKGGLIIKPKLAKRGF